MNIVLFAREFRVVEIQRERVINEIVFTKASFPWKPPLKSAIVRVRASISVEVFGASVSY
jgi:hypothetical protein